MNGLLRYLIAFVVALLFCPKMADEALSSNVSVEESSFAIIDSDYSIDNPSSEVGFTLPRRVTFTSTIRLTQNNQRQQNLHRYYSDVAKIGIVKFDAKYHLVQLNYIFIYSFVMNPVHKLISYGRLII